MNRVIAIACLVIALAAFGWAYERVNGITNKLDAVIHTDELNNRRIESIGLDLAAIQKQQQLLSPGDLGNRRLDVRLFMIRSHLAQTQSPLIFIGDSITEAALLPSELCSHPIVNAGIGGMTAESYADLSGQILAGTRASLIVIAIGTNDSSTHPPKLFGPRYRDLIAVAKAHSEHLLLVGIPPLGNGPLRDYFDPAAIAANEATIQKIAAENSIPFVGLGSLGAIADTVDGVHLSPKAYKTWMPLILNAATRILESQAQLER